MITITPDAEVALEHRALHVAAASSGHIVALSREGAGTLVGPDLATAGRFDVDCHIRGVSLDPRGGLMALLEDGALSLIGLPELDERQRLGGAFESCLFSPSGRLLWTASRVGEDAAEVEVRETRNWAVVAQCTVEDPFGDSGLMLFPHPNENRAVLWVAAGQDGQCLYWGNYADSRLTMELFETLLDMAPPAFDEAGQRFLMEAEGALWLCKYPHGKESCRIPWPLENDPPAETVVLLGNDHALAHSGNGRLFLVDLKRLEMGEEIELRGHESRPVSQVFPSMKQDMSPCTDLLKLVPLSPRTLLSVHQIRPMKSLAGWRDRLAMWRAPQSTFSTRTP